MLALLALVPVPRALAQLSPGPLARAHARLDGPAQCLSCHQVNRRASMDAACVTCHREIAGLLAAQRGLHAREGASRCSSCHPDHAGLSFSLVSWTADSVRGFDHRRAGWVLQGAHAEARCDACHEPGRRHGVVASLAPGARPAAWTGLDTGCPTCHEDVHRTTLGNRCADCHDAARWGPAPGFSHDRTDYPLTGAHREVKCGQCHSADSGRLDPAFPRLAFGDCSGCHRDPHQGRLAGRCADCHVTSSFADRKAGGFNHARTRYPLRGRHAAVRCEACHQQGGDRQPAFATCGACHTDAHAGTATLAGRAADCASCHDERGFTPATFTVAQHQATAYPLEGRHAAVRCVACHTRPAGTVGARGSARVDLRPPRARCGDCHADPHRGETARVAEGECSACHQVQGWAHTTFTAARHEDLGFALTGRHATAACGSCHVTGARAEFRLTTTTCGSCHLDPHDGRYATCEECHGTDTFKPSTVSAATHQRYGLALDGAHAAVPCLACHQDLERPAGGAALRRAGATTPGPIRLTTPRSGCVACHEDRHAGQFDAAPARACERCHGVVAFRPAARFDHGRDARFGLDGRHASVACERCHEAGQYRGTPTACEACHR